MFKDLDDKLKIKYVPDILKGRFDYLKSYPQCDASIAIYMSSNNSFISVPVVKIANGVIVPEGSELPEYTDLDTAIQFTDNKIKEIINEYQNICIKKMPHCYEYEGKYLVAIRLAYHKE
jgi:hypothetical protein